MDSALWLRYGLGVSRAPFLTLSLVSIVFAWSLAFFQTGLPSFFDSFLILIAMISSHIGVNALNEYQDFKSGLDLSTDKTIFSGGSGTLVDHPEFAERAKQIAFGAIGLAVLIGLWFVFSVGIELLPVGVLGLWIVMNYTTVINRHPWLCLVAPGFGIGILATLGSVYILSGGLSWEAVFLGLGYALLLNNLLLLNQFPDKQADEAVQRCHMWIAKGPVVSLALFRAQWISAFALVAISVLFADLPWFGLSILCVMMLVYPLWRYTQSEQCLSDNLLSALGKNVLLCHAYPASLSAILIISRWLT